MKTSPLRLAAWAALLASGWLVGCSFDDRHQPCRADSDCNDGVDQVCYQGFCVPAPESTGSSEVDTSGSSATSVDGGREAGGTGGAKVSGASGAKAGDGAGGDGEPGSAGDAAMPNTDAGGSGPIMSTACSEGDMQACQVPWQSARALGGCGEGTQRCVSGAWDTCVPKLKLAAEACNKLDDDCDGKIDEDADNNCYPGATVGCEANDDGTFNCKGACKAGVQRCVDGKLGVCEGSVVPTKEDCNAVGIDEDCNGNADDGCVCAGNGSRSCYSGAANTVGVGICSAGTQRCEGGTWGACVGETTAQAEVCNGRDDNCNGRIDDVVGLGALCNVPMQQGICAVGTRQCQAGAPALQCVASNPKTDETCNEQDDDCDGTIDNVPAASLQMDPLHCGSCNRACSAGDKCCAGGCVNTNTDEMNCGSCGKACSTAQTCMNGMCMNAPPMDAGAMCAAAADCATDELCCDGKCIASDLTNCGACGQACTGTAPACCSKVCVDLSQPANCGACGNVCPTLDGGMSCTCATTGTAGTYQCLLNGTACP